MNMAAQQTDSMMLQDLLAGMADITVAQNCAITGLTLDSREVKPGDLFIACKGTVVHGAHYINKALHAGAAAVIWEEEGLNSDDNIVQLIPESATVPVLKISDLTSQVGLIASRYYGEPSEQMAIIGITGTDGKTSCSQFIAQALNKAGVFTGIMGTLGYGLPGEMISATHTTPDALRVQKILSDMYRQRAEAVVMEASSHGLEQGRVNAVHFDTAVLTNLSRDHLDYHVTVEAYANAKRKLFEMPGLKNVILNIDDDFGRLLATQYTSHSDSQVNAIGYSLDPTNAATQEIPVITITDLRLLPSGMSLQIESPWGRAKVNTSLMAHFNASNLLATLAVLVTYGITFREATELLETLETVPGRMETFVGHMDQPRVIVDYAHTPDALRQALIALRDHGPNKLHCLFGCGGDRDQGKRPLMGQAAAELADVVVVTDDNPRSEAPEFIVEQILEGIGDKSNVVVEHDRATAIREIIANAGAGDLVLIAGKGHETTQTIGDKKLSFSDREFVMQCLQDSES